MHFLICSFAQVYDRLKYEFFRKCISKFLFKDKNRNLGGEKRCWGWGRERKIPKVYYRLSKWRGKLEPRCGGVLRDEDERWIEGFYKYLGSTTKQAT
jgi:hypothetical protein